MFELVVGRFEQTPVSDVAAGLEHRSSLSPSTATIAAGSNGTYVATITPGGIKQRRDDGDIPLAGNVAHLNLLVKDRYWSVDGGVSGSTVLKTLEVRGRSVSSNSPPPSAEGYGNPDDQPALAPSDFVGKEIEIEHDNGRTVGCLDVTWGHAQNGQNVQTWECNGTDAQTWRLEQRTAGDHAGRYRLVSALAGGQTYCLDNRGDFRNSDRMGIWSCVADTHGAAPNQTFDLTAAGDGLTLTFTRGSASVVMWAERGTSWPRGNVGQRSGGSGVAAEWRFKSDEPPALGPQPQPQPVAVVQPAASVTDATVTEAAGAKLAFTVLLDRAVTSGDGTVSVDYATRDGTATAGADYTAASGTLTFAVDEQEKTVNVTVLEDSHDDGGETLELVLSNPVGATITDGTGTGTINNADPMPQGVACALRPHGGRAGARRGARTTRGGAGTGRGGRHPRGSTIGHSPASRPRLKRKEVSHHGRHRPRRRAGSTAPPASDSAGPDGGTSTDGEAADPYGNSLDDSHTLTTREVLLGTSFALTGEADEAGGDTGVVGSGGRIRLRWQGGDAHP